MSFGRGWGGGGGSSSGGGGGSSDVTPPLIADFNPPAGTPIAKTGNVQFTVTDESSGIARVIIVAAYDATGIDELVFDGDEFRGAYAGRSRREIIAGGFQYTVARGVGGFPSDPKFRVFAVDRAGNESA